MALASSYSSPIRRTDAVTLRVSPYSETSQLVTWMTPDAGRVVTLIKGACRPRSGFLGQYDLFGTSELLYYERQGNGIHIAKECALLNPRLALRDNWRAAAVASYVCDVLGRTSMDGAGGEELFQLAVGTLDFLATTGATIPVLIWFELAFVSAIGVAPRLDACVLCGGHVGGTVETLFSYGDGGVLCGSCEARSHRDMIRLKPDVLAMLQAWQRAESPHAAWRTRCTPRQTVDAAHVIGAFLNFHLDVSPLCASREVVVQMLE